MASDPRYVLDVEIGRGGLGRVVRARDERIGRTIAIKTLLVRDADMQRRFEREARITAQLEHPAIIPVYDIGLDREPPFIAMKLVSGRTLHALITEAKKFSDRIALLPSVIAVADALAYAHSQRIVHRDVKA